MPFQHLLCQNQYGFQQLVHYGRPRVMPRRNSRTDFHSGGAFAFHHLGLRFHEIATIVM